MAQAPGTISADSLTLPANPATATFTYVPRGGSSSFTVWTRPTQNSTVGIFRIPKGGGSPLALGSGGAVAVTAGAEDQQLIPYPVAGQIVIVVTNAGATPGTVTCDVAEG